MVEIVWKRSAEDDLLRIFAALEDVRPGSGDRLLQTVDATLGSVKRHPNMAPFFEKPMRRLVFGSFGYGLFYTVEARGIIVHALIHLSQSPDAIREKIRRFLNLQ